MTARTDGPAADRQARSTEARGKLAAKAIRSLREVDVLVNTAGGSVN